MFKALYQVGLVVALSSVAGMAFAAPQHGNPSHDGWQQQHGQHVQKSDRQHRVDHQKADQRQQGRDQKWQHQQRETQRQRAKDQRHPSRWQRGHRYTGSYVIVNNYNHYHLRQPPRGYRWVRANNEYLLIATATQLILDIANQ